VPLSGLAILFGVDRIPDMFRSAVNMTSHMVWAVVVQERAMGGGDPGAGAQDQAEPASRTGRS
jgi:Na+/H+-dicarboxylate symporter